MENFDELFASTGGKTLKPDTIGETLGGVIVSAESRQMTDFTTGEPLTWDDGKPCLQVVVTVDLGTTDTDGNPEQGCIYIKTWGEQRQALKEALKESGLDSMNKALAPGNHMSITFIGEKPNEKNPRLNAIKLYKYTIEPRANLGAAVNAALAEPAPTAAPAAPAPAAPAPAGGVDIAALIKAALPDAQIASIAGIDPSAVTAIRAALG